MATEVLYPDGTVFTLTNLTGAYTDIAVDADTSASDTNFISADSDALSTLRASFSSPSGALTTGAGVQNFKVRLRLTQNAPQNVDWELRETGGGTALQSGSVSVTSTSFAAYTISWDAGNLADGDGSEVEIYLSAGSASGPPGNRWTFEISACEWNVDYTASTTVDVPAASLTLAGAAPSISAGASVTVPAASLTLAGAAPLIASGAAVDVPATTLTLAGLAPVIDAGTTNVNIDVPAAALTLAGAAPSIAAGAAISVPVVTIELAGATPGISTGVAINVPAASVSLAAAAPSIATGVAVNVPAADITLSGAAPTISAGAGGAAIDVPAASMSMEALVPSISAGFTAGVVTMLDWDMRTTTLSYDKRASTVDHDMRAPTLN